MYRLLAIDLDGTLLTPQHTISAYTKTVLNKAVDAGMSLVVATGRVPYIFHEIGNQLPLNAPQITSNGATIIDLHTNTLLHEQFVPVDLVLPAMEAAQEIGLQLCYYSDEYLYAEQKLYDLHNWYLSGIPVTITPDIVSLHTQPCIKLGAYGNVSTIREKRQELERRFAGKLYVTQTAQEWLEILHPEVSKANALKVVTRLLNVKPEEVIAFGDNHNDIGMLRFAGLGIAMGNAHDEIKAVADYVTLSNAEDGVAVALEKFVLSRSEVLQEKSQGA
jgi:Cof subfamily protein (haloacid dehalogenase superfamily)